ncbi:MAG: cupin domain-containing protein [Dermatophilaceae bacterium]
MHLIDTTTFEPLADRKYGAGQILASDTASARVIRVAPGADLPPHTHGVSDLFLYVVSGRGLITAPDGTQTPFPPGALAHFTGDEELRVGNTGDAELTLLAVLSPPFPPKR